MRKALQIAANRPWLLAGLLPVCLLLAGCGSDQDAALTVIAIGAPGSPFERGAHLPPAARLVRAATAEGLVGFDEQGQIVPALADRWIVTDDGLSYIFRLRDGTWSDGSALTAQTLRTTLRETIAGLRDTPLALDLAGIDEIRVMTGRVIEIRLSAPMPNLLQLLAHEKEIVGSSAYVDEFPDAIALLAGGQVRVAPLVTGRVSLADALEGGLEALRRPEAAHVKILVTPA